MDRYVGYLHEQVAELLRGYGTVGVMWFDGEWEDSWIHEYGQALYNLCRSLQPGVIVNNRVDTGRGGFGGMSGDGCAGDFGTPEQEIPATGLPGVDWETCMTMGEHWGFNSKDIEYKSSKELIRNLVDVASKGGNYLINVGPSALGEFPAPAVDRLSDIGRWMDKNGESIYGTEAGVLGELSWGRCTIKRKTSVTFYLHIFDWPTDGKLFIYGLASSPDRVISLGCGEVKCIYAESRLSIDLAECQQDEFVTVLRLDFDANPGP
jgi:alpha-L-fucosidase